jgi:hypothetical protein
VLVHIYLVDVIFNVICLFKTPENVRCVNYIVFIKTDICVYLYFFFLQVRSTSSLLTSKRNGISGVDCIQPSQKVSKFTLRGLFVNENKDSRSLTQCSVYFGF